MTSTLAHDLKYAFRSLRKTPGFTAVALLTLALGIGANTTIFSVVESVLLRPLPYPNPESLIRVWNTYPSLAGFSQLGLSPGDFQDFRSRTGNILDLAAYIDLPQGFNMTGQGEPERLEARFATSGLFPLLGVRVEAGRVFTPEEDKAGSARVVLISHRLWQRRFGSDPAIVGRSVTLDGQGYLLAGVLPAGFRLAPLGDLWINVGQYADDLTSHLHHEFTVVGRLKPHVTVSQAQAELTVLNRQEEVNFPDTHKNWTVRVGILEDPAAAKMRLALLVLFGVVGLVLLIACANIVNLLLARNASRQKEIALRIALGASRLSLVRQLLTESVLLSLLGGALGIVFAIAGLRSLTVFIPPDLAGVREAGINGWVLGFTVAACLLAGVLSGLIPAIQSLKRDLNSVLKEGGRTSAASVGQTIRSILVVSEIALALMPLIGAGLLIRSFYRVLEVNPGFQPDRILTMEVEQPALPFAEQNKLTPDQQRELARKRSIQFEQMAAEIRNLPGVRGVGGVSVLPLGSEIRSASRFVIEGRPLPNSGTRPIAETRSVSLEYFAAMGIPLRSGRLFEQQDYAGLNIVINEALANKFWPAGDSIGKRVNFCSLNPTPCWCTIVGVIGNVHQYGLDAAPSVDAYFAGGWTPYLVIRATADPLALASGVIDAVHKSDPTLPVTNVTTLDGLLSGSISPRRFSMLLLGTFAALALLLAAVGIYGVMSYAVSLRTNELGVRMALGAQARDVRNLIAGQGLRLALAGVAIGLAGALALTKILASLLYEIKPADPITFGAVALLLTLVAILACHIPARRATRVDPIVALRHD